MALQNLLVSEMYYPPGLLAEKQAGNVSLLLHINAAGGVASLEAEEGAREEFVSEARRLLEYILWEPALLDGIAAPGNTRIEIEFRPKKYKRIQKQRIMTLTAASYAV